MKQRKADALRAFGQNMPDVMRAIKKLEQEGRWRGRMPIGPFGRPVKSRLFPSSH